MSRALRSIYQFGALAGAALILLRFFPLIVRVLEVAAISLFRFWWVVLAIGLLLWLAWVLRQRNSG